MRIAFLVNGFPLISETFIARQIADAAERGHDVEIFALSVPRGIRLEDGPAAAAGQWPVTIFDVPSDAAGRLRQALRMLRDGHRRHWPAMLRSLDVRRFGRDALTLGLLLRSAPVLARAPLEFDVIHCQFGPLGRLALQLRAIGAWSGAIVTAFRGYDVTQVLRREPRAYDDLFRHGELLLPVSRSLALTLIAHGADARRVVVHHSGIDCARWPFHARWRRGSEPLRALSIGRLVEKKGFVFGVQAVARLVDAGVPVQYDIIGDGPERAALTRAVEQLGVRDHVTLRGWRQPAEVGEFLRRAHVLLAPSAQAHDGDEEGIPNVLKEAMACGIPVVATRHSGIPELVEDGISGYLVRERDALALADRLQRLLSEVDRWPEMGQAGRRKVEREFDHVRLGTALDQLYRRARGQPEGFRSSRTTRARPATVDEP